MPINATVKLCGARSKRHKQPCKQPAIKDKKRCRMHGGLSTGPKTPEGKLRSAQANLKTGLHTNEAILERQRMRALLKWCKDTEYLE
jgi:hypothetical protein